MFDRFGIVSTPLVWPGANGTDVFIGRFPILMIAQELKYGAARRLLVGCQSACYLCRLVNLCEGLHVMVDIFGQKRYVSKIRLPGDLHDGPHLVDRKASFRHSLSEVILYERSCTVSFARPQPRHPARVSWSPCVIHPYSPWCGTTRYSGIVSKTTQFNCKKRNERDSRGFQRRHRRRHRRHCRRHSLSTVPSASSTNMLRMSTRNFYFTLPKSRPTL